MDFLKEIVKEIGDEYTQVAADIEENERFIDTGSYIFNGLVAYLAVALLPSLVKPLLVKRILPLLLSRTFWIVTLMVTAFILILKQQLIRDYLNLVGLI